MNEMNARKNGGFDGTGDEKEAEFIEAVKRANQNKNLFFVQSEPLITKIKATFASFRVRSTRTFKIFGATKWR